MAETGNILGGTNAIQYPAANTVKSGNILATKTTQDSNNTQPAIKTKDVVLNGLSTSKTGGAITSTTIDSGDTITDQVSNISQLSQQDLKILARYGVSLTKDAGGNYAFTINNKPATPQQVAQHLQNVVATLKSELNTAKQNVDGAVNQFNMTVQVNWSSLSGTEQSAVTIQVKQIVTPTYQGFNARYEKVNQVLNQ